jgi:hypothetical protein
VRPAFVAVKGGHDLGGEGFDNFMSPAGDGCYVALHRHKGRGHDDHLSSGVILQLRRMI